MICMDSMEERVRHDLAKLPEDMRNGAVAGVALFCARVLDEGALTPRDAQGFARELRLAEAQLREMAPGEVAGDATDEVQKKRAERMGITA